MGNILLMAAVAVMMLGGFFLMKRLDAFLAANKARKARLGRGSEDGKSPGGSGGGKVV